jgi:hypothetical protein
LRTSHSSACGLGSGISTTLPATEIAHQSTGAADRQLRLALLARELDQQDGLGLADQARSITGRKAGLARASSIMVRSTSSTAVGFSLTMCWALSIAL